ncbi:MAG: hypothetical protein HY011_12940 [Acidobacteria bacterium]|nr:hypothetical protein [Acidobacteriota bacterium]
MKPQLLQTILLGGLVAGALDITAASINSTLHGGGPVRVFQSVAGGLLGRDTFQGGWKTAALGLAVHFLIATVWMALYAAASLRLPVLSRQAMLCGPLYGIVVYLVMYGVVLPLSAYHSKFFNQAKTALLTAVLIHIFCVGLPMALVTRWRLK